MRPALMLYFLARSLVRSSRIMSAIEKLEQRPITVAAPPLWPLFVAPFAGLVYYLVLFLAFLDAMRKVVDTTDVEVLGLSWGHHWIYRILAEGVSVSFGT